MATAAFVQENEKSRDIIIEQRLHKLIIGTKGENIGKIRDAHPNVVSFSGVSSSMIVFRSAQIVLCLMAFQCFY